MPQQGFRDFPGLPEHEFEPFGDRQRPEPFQFVLQFPFRVASFQFQNPVRRHRWILSRMERVTPDSNRLA